MSFLVTFFVKEMRFLSSFFFPNSKFGIKLYYWSFFFWSKLRIFCFLRIFEDVSTKKKYFEKSKNASDNRAQRDL